MNGKWFSTMYVRDSLSLSLSLPLPLTHSFVHSNVVVVVVFGCCWKNCFAFKTRVFSLSQNMSFHLILVMHSQLTHTQSRTHTISVLSAIELLNLAPYRYAISITTTTKAKKSDTQMTMRRRVGTRSECAKLCLSNYERQEKKRGTFQT